MPRLPCRAASGRKFSELLPRSDPHAYHVSPLRVHRGRHDAQRHRVRGGLISESWLTLLLILPGYLPSGTAGQFVVSRRTMD